MQQRSAKMSNNLDNLLSSLDDINSQIENLKREKSQLETVLQESIADNVASQLSDNDYGCGTANISTDNFKIKVVISKDVKYEQHVLADLFDRIKESGDDPFEYIKIKYDVSEAAFKNWPSHIKAVFEPMRTVSQSKPKITFEKKGE